MEEEKASKAGKRKQNKLKTQTKWKLKAVPPRPHHKGSECVTGEGPKLRRGTGTVPVRRRPATVSVTHG